MLDITGKTITIIGAQRSAMAVAKLIQHYQGRVKISQTDPVESIPEDFLSWIGKNQIELELR